MISQELIKKCRDFSYNEAVCYGSPPSFYIDYIVEIVKKLSKILGANEDVVVLGYLLADCQLGIATKENKGSSHIDMGMEKAREIFKDYPELETEEIENIIFCIKEHHGAQKFNTLESEICCNADCYKFLTFKGIIGGLNTIREIEINGLIKLFSDKVNEKWEALTLDICKKELEKEYQTIRNFFNFYKLEL